MALLIAALSPAVMSAQTKKGSVRDERQKIEDKTVNGTIIDENGEPLIGATVMLKGTPKGTATDLDGNFSLLISGKHPTLVISYVGMESKEVSLEYKGNKFQYVKATLKPLPNLMNEVVVTGYQNIKRENATGAYQIITAEDLEKRYTGDVTSNLEGMVPGLVYDPKSNYTDENALKIRGTGTFQARTAPLVVVDGLPIEGGINTVNPYDIDKVTVLKDASAAAIYGARASNGVIVITTKKAHGQKLTVDFSADLTVTEKTDYSNFKYANAKDYIALERYNFNAMKNDGGNILEDNVRLMNNGRINTFSPVMRLFMQNYMGTLSDADLNSTLSSWEQNDYQKEWRDLHDRTGVRQQYNLALRVDGSILNSSLVVNYGHNNNGVVDENNQELSFKYQGLLKAASWVDLNFGVNIINDKSKTHAGGGYSGMNSFLPYQSMYNPDGTLANMEAGVYPGESAFGTEEYELKDPTYNFVDDFGKNWRKYDYKNIRANVNALFRLPIEGWTMQGMFQYEDISSRNQTEYKADSYYMRDMFNRFTTSEEVTEWVDDPDWFSKYMADPAGYDRSHAGLMQQTFIKTIHNIPEGGLLTTTNNRSEFYTFRAQTRFARQFGKHDIDAVAGFEYRQTHTKTDSNSLYGYDHQTQTNGNVNANWALINNPTGTQNVLGRYYPMPITVDSPFTTSDVLHRFYSYYFTANYLYDSRYSVSGSYRVDKTDLFGTDPKFRGRPLWSVGASWNINNEQFMQNITWVSALKLRASYGYTGNIDSSVSSILTARIGTNRITGDKAGTVRTPPNDQLRWEKTRTWNIGLDFGLFNYRLQGSLDFYNKQGSDLLARTDLDPTTGWSTLTINNGKMTNRGIELQLDANVIQQHSRSDFGLNLGFNLGYNKNKVTYVPHQPASGSEYLTTQLHQGYPYNSIFSIDYTGLIEKDGVLYGGWKGHDGVEHTESTSSSLFTIEDAVFSGSSDPLVSGSFSPELRWNGFSLGAMMAFYTGHYMRIDNDIWTNIDYVGSSTGYTSGGLTSEYLRYWNGEQGVPPNGHFASSMNGTINNAFRRNTNVVHADYLKVRNVVLSYNFDPKLCRKIGMSDIRLRFQMNNLATWVRNAQGIDPEAVSITGMTTQKAPRSYTFSIHFTL